MKNKSHGIIENILDHARWAPSGDNMQTWRFEIVDERHFTVHAWDTRDFCVYDLDGRASQIAFGVLLETIAIAATRFKLQVNTIRRSNSPESKLIFDIFLTKNDAIEPSALLPFIKTRCTQRRMMKITPLSHADKSALEAALNPAHSVQWIEGWRGKLNAAWLMFRNAKIRLIMPEAYQVHSTVIEKNARFSVDKIPDQAVGLDPVTTRIMHWTMKSWQRVNFFNTYLAGTLLPRIELDLLPGLFCAAHFVIIADRKPAATDDYLDAGRALQRFWLTATGLGLHVQPEMTPLIFARYVREQRSFSATPKVQGLAASLAKRTQMLVSEPEQTVFLGRIGSGKAAATRSIRLPLQELLISKPTH
ncbi:MAG: molybdopterin biosynthesis protein MoeY [Gammaproteobacteria bacterium HGW-Gammaproteobacteria-3]|nr:MAG: molybdopterin biosynthesis protein MoeY [Gammaproteobacteria bacterium HGW-Gammaproteobacteria-3]